MGLILDGAQPLLPSAGGASLPTATAAGEVPLADGAGTAYTAGALLLAGTDAARPAAAAAYLGRKYYATDLGTMGAVYTCITDGAGNYGWSAAVLAADGEAEGAAQISDGAGGARFTSADVSALLASANAAAALAAIGASASPYARIDAPLDAGQGWTIVAASGGGATGSTAASFPGGGIGRLTMAATANLHDLEGPRLERAITWAPGVRWRFRVTPVAKTFTTGTPFGCLYLRNSAGSQARLLVTYASSGTITSVGWATGFIGSTANVIAWNGTGSIEILIDASGSASYGAVHSTTGIWTLTRTLALDFLPSHVGIVGATDGATDAVMDFRDFIIESFG